MFKVKGITYKRIPYLLRHPSAWFDRLTNRAQGPGSRHREFRDFLNPQFVEPVEMNPVVTPAFDR